MLTELGSSPVVSGMLSLITSFGLQYLTQDFQHFARAFFSHSSARKLVLFALLYGATKSLRVSLIMCVAIILVNDLARIHSQVGIARIRPEKRRLAQRVLGLVKRLTFSTKEEKSTQTENNTDHFHMFH